MHKPYGVMPALVTPLTEDGKLKEDSFRQLIEHTIQGGVHGLFVLGTTGEFYGLDLEEKRKILEIAIDQAKGRVYVYAGANDITTNACIEMVKVAEECGVDGVSVLTPYFLMPNQTELKEHFKAIAASTKLPVILYNNVGKTNVDISPDIVEELADVENIIGIKDTSGDMTKMGEYLRRTVDKDFDVFCGKDTLFLAALAYGAVGAVASSANVAPGIVAGIYNAYQEGNIEKARELQFKLTPLRQAFEGTFPGVVKEAVELLGIDPGVALKPYGNIPADKKEKLTNIIKDLDLYKIYE